VVERRANLSVRPLRVLQLLDREGGEGEHDDENEKLLHDSAA
jgi:hypothetical protein